MAPIWGWGDERKKCYEMRREMKGAERVGGHSEIDLFLKIRVKFKP